MNFIKAKDPSKHTDAASTNVGGVVCACGRGSTPDQRFGENNKNVPGVGFHGINKPHKDVRVNSIVVVVVEE